MSSPSQSGADPPPRDREDSASRVWDVLKDLLQVAGLVAMVRQHEALTWTARALVVLVDVARVVWSRRR